MTTTRLWTADDLATLDYDGRAELLAGELVLLGPIKPRHGGLAARIGSDLFSYVDEHDLGYVGIGNPGFFLGHNPDTVRGPDVGFVRKDRLDPSGGDLDTYFEGAPDLDIEIVSPTDRLIAVRAKAEAWLANGSRMVIVIHPTKKQVDVYYPNRSATTLNIGDEIDGGDVVPGWRFPLARLYL